MDTSTIHNNSPFSLSELLRSLSVILSSAVQDKEVEVLFSLDCSVPNCLRGDSLRLQQVLLNLAGNAIKFTKQGEVVITVRGLAITAEQAKLEFHVRDTGIGIAPEMLRDAFSGFTQAEASTTRCFGGAGLGLTISRELVNMMGGELEVESEPGTGSNFYFSVTVERDLDAESAEINSRKTIAIGSDHPAKVLIVDDNVNAREMLAAMASSFGWHVETAASGLDAIRLIETGAISDFPFDVVFIDLMMPGVDGMETTRRLRQLCHDGRAPVVIMVTAHGRQYVSESASDATAPVDGYLLKPLTPSMLLNTVNTITSGRYVVTQRQNYSRTWELLS